MSLQPWYSVCTPHKDIREGRLDEATFAVDLWGVVSGQAPEVYLDSEEFFQKTYMTEGLKSVLLKTLKGLSGSADAGDRILSLQTSFGGGKTHMLLALYHFAKSNGKIEVLQELLKETQLKWKEQQVNVAVFTNKTCDATQGRKLPDGTHLRTIWGEIAYQLGGASLYKLIEPNDKARTVPQGLFEEVLRNASPCLILIDELADYCVGASGTKVGETSLADQTISFVQQFSEAVGKVPGAMLVATLPASNLEVGGGEKGQEILQSLEKRFGRMAADSKPVKDDEIFSVVRRRLFDSVGDASVAKETAKAYWEM
ncbi:MAG: ATP-binding protein, partial [Ignavibacteriae bacterium]|nr:ATP-binding protein [Ignavibacteriota bacterium]